MFVLLIKMNRSKDKKQFFKLNRTQFNLVVFFICLLICWYFIYPIGFKVNGPKQPAVQSLPYSLFISIFPAVIFSLMVNFFRKSNSSYWLKSMVEIVVLVARADGSISRAEQSVILKSFNKQFGFYRAKKANRLFSELKDSKEIDLKTSCRRLNEVFETSNATIFMDVIVNVAVADQFLSKSEEDLLHQLATYLGLHKNSLKAILARKRFISERVRENKKSEPIRVSGLSKAYELLGLEEGDSFAQVKKAYRDLAKIYHPDKAGEIMDKKYAKAQFQVISEAYNLIKKRRL